MNIKMKFVLPLIYALIVLFSFAISSEGLLMIINFPMVLIYLACDVYLGIRFGDGFYFAIIGGVVQYFMIGLLWDYIAEKLRTTRIGK